MTRKDENDPIMPLDRYCMLTNENHFTYIYYIQYIHKHANYNTVQESKAN